MTLIPHLDQLPVTPPSLLVGRSALFQDLSQRLTPEYSHSVLLVGPPGIGKKAIAATLAATRLQAWGEVLWLRSNPNNPQALLMQALRDYHLQNAEQPETQLKELLGQRTPLIVIQTSGRPELAQDFIEAYAYHTCPVLTISSQDLPGPWSAVNLAALEFSASQDLWHRHARASLIPVPVLDTLLGYLRGQPFAIRLAALQVAHQAISADDLAHQLDFGQASQDILEILFRTLEKPQQGLLMAISASFANGISAELLSHIVGTSARPLCQVLLERGFLTLNPSYPGLYYELHPLLQQFGRDQLIQNGTFETAQNRMLEGLATFTRYYAAPKHDWAQNPLLLEMDNLLEAALYSHQTGQQEPLEQLLHALAGVDIFVHNWGYQLEFKHLKAALQPAQAPAPPRPDSLPELALEPTSLEDTGTFMAVPSKSDTQPHQALTAEQVAEEETDFVSLSAGLTSPPPLPPPVVSMALTTQLQNLEWALSEAEQRHNTPEMGRLNRVLGEYHLEQGQTEFALRHFEQALHCYDKLGDLNNVLAILEVLASQNLHYHRPEPSLDYTKRGLNIARQVNDIPRRYRFMTLLGDGFSALNDRHNAMEAYKRAVKLARMLEEPLATGITLGKLASVYMDMERYREATVALNQAIGLFEQVGRRDLQGRTLGNLGTALGHLGRWHEAGQRHAAALLVARELNDTEEERFQLSNLAYVAESEGHFKWAINYLRQGLYLALLDEDGPAIADITYDLGRLLAQDPDQSPQALVLLEAAQSYHPKADLGRLIKETRARIKHRERLGMAQDPAEADLLLYAAAAYPHR